MAQDTGAVVAFFADDLLPGAHVDELKAFIEDCPEPEVPPTVLTEEYFVSPETVQQPCNPVEALIAKLLRQPDVASAIGDVDGAEWSWHHYLDSDDPKAFHTDCNRRLVEVEGSDEQVTVRTNPHWSSVVYLTDEGGPTVVWQDNDFVVCQPRRGRYFLFRGDLPHGVLHAPESFGKDRIILSITWWRNSKDATGSRDRPPGPLGSFSSHENCRERGANSAMPLLMPLMPEPIFVPFAKHKDQWLSQRLPLDLYISPEDCKPPAPTAVRYVDEEYDANWCPLVSHALH